MNKKLNAYVRTVLSTDFPVQSFFGTLTDSHPMMDHKRWQEAGSPHLLVAACGLPVKETNSLYIWFDNMSYGNHKCLACRFDLDTFNPKTSAPTDACIAPVGEATFLFDNVNDARPSYLVFPEYEDMSANTRRILWSKICPAEGIMTFPLAAASVEAE